MPDAAAAHEVRELNEVVERLREQFPEVEEEEGAFGGDKGS